MTGPYKKSDFNRPLMPLLPMPELSERVSVSQAYTAAEFKKISYGYLSWDMDMRWDIFLEGNKLYIHRSWTGRCIYIIEFTVHTEGAEATNITINRDPDQLKIRPISEALETAFWVLKELLIEDVWKRLPEDWVD